MDPIRALRQIAFHLERDGEPTYRVRAFRNAATIIAGLPEGDLEKRVRNRTLTSLPGIGKTTAAVVSDAVGGRDPEYLTNLVQRGKPVPDGGDLRRALRGDCHTHSDWSDGGSPIEEMAETARDLGHEWMVLTDHSPRLTVANGLSAERLRRQLDVIAEVNERLAPFRLLSGIEVDILDDGTLDQEPELLAELDLVVASVHSKLKMPAREMTARLLAAVSQPRVNVLGHCTGRLVTGRGRPESAFDAEKVFQACKDNGVAVEINCRPDRLDPPRRLLSLALDIGCTFAIDSDAHAPGQLDWQPYGCARALDCGVTEGDVLNARPVDSLLTWTN